MTEEQRPEGIEGLSHRLWHAQSGRYFLFKWILIAGTNHALLIPFQIWLAHLGTNSPTQVYWSMCFARAALLATMQGFVLFSWWRAWLWITLHTMANYVVGVYWGKEWPVLLVVWLFITFFEIPFFVGIRRRPVFWILGNVISLAVQVGVLKFTADWIFQLRR